LENLPYGIWTQQSLGIQNEASISALIEVNEVKYNIPQKWRIGFEPRFGILPDIYSDIANTTEKMPIWSRQNGW